MSKLPWPDRLKKIVLRSPVRVHDIRFIDRDANRVIAFGSRNDPLGARENQSRFEGRALRHGDRFDQALMMELRHQRRIAVIAKPARVNRRRHEVASQRVHQHQRREAGGVAGIVSIVTAS